MQISIAINVNCNPSAILYEGETTFNSLSNIIFQIVSVNFDYIFNNTRSFIRGCGNQKIVLLKRVLKFHILHCILCDLYYKDCAEDSEGDEASLKRFEHGLEEKIT